MNTKRIETLVDGIFAIAMTLLVLNFEIPQFTGVITNAVIWNALVELWPKMFTYGLSFILLAIFWRVNHQQFYLIKKSDTPLLWINIFWLMFVALVPFSTSLIGEYGEFEISELFFQINFLLIGILFNLNWRYAASRGLLDKSVNQKKIERIKRINLALPIAAVIAIILVFIIPEYSSLAYLSTYFLKKFFKASI
ncbi:MAG: TMEM175 family protein [Methanobacteriaceae archaeon]|nr:TMEM175 family protein [Methanobacteriaceae archaeon]